MLMEIIIVGNGPEGKSQKVIHQTHHPSLPACSLTFFPLAEIKGKREGDIL